MKEVFAGPTRRAVRDLGYEYYPSGLTQAVRLPSGCDQSFTYNWRDWLTEIGQQAQGVLFAARYTHYADGSVHNAEFNTAGSPGAEHYYYSHELDALGRLTSADYTTGT